jgi:hypothetical protein
MFAELQGSPKQISWAIKIRTDRMNRWKKSDAVVFDEIESILNDQTSAAWWITYREKEIAGVLPYLEVGSAGMAKDYKSMRSAVPIYASPDKKVYEPCSDEGMTHRYIGELRDAVTGEIVVDPDCPF